MKLPFLGLSLIVFILISLLFIGKVEVTTSKVENSTVKFHLKDFPEHGISLVAPTDTAFAKTVPPNPYSVILKNTNSRMVVGYAIKWECTDGRTAVNRPLLHDRIVSNVAGVIFMYGEERERREIMNRMAQVIKPKSTWLISFDFNPRQIGVAGTQPDPEFDNEFFDPVRAACPNMTVIADGIFFDDGTFIGPDTSNFFAETKAQVDARYEILVAVQNRLKSGNAPDKVFSWLEQVRDETQNLGEQPTVGDLHAYFRSLFALDLLGKRNLWGTEKTIAEIQQNLSAPWVKPVKI